MKQIPLSLLLLTGFFALASSNGHGQTADLCKWIDENGTVHYDHECPEGVNASSVTVDTAPAGGNDDPYAQTRQRVAASKTAAEGSAARGAKSSNDLSRMSADGLRAACDQARNSLLEPERNALIRQCKAQGDQDEDYCERFYADYGNGGMRGGRRIQPKYGNLPECVAAREARD